MATKKKKKQRAHAKKIDQKARRKMAPEADREAEPETGVVATAPAQTSSAETLSAKLALTLKRLLKRGSGKEGAQTAPAADPETESRMAGLIKITIIIVTFVSIAALSMFSQELDGASPGVGVVVIRFALLSTFAVIYFLMLYMTRQSRRNADDKATAEKK